MILFIGADLPFSEESEAAGSARGCEGQFGSAQQRLLRAIDQGSVTVHAFDPRGLETGAVGAEAFRNDAKGKVVNWPHDSRRQSQEAA